MRIKRIRVQNLRSIPDQTLELNDYTCLVGPNGSGKSTFLCALNIFFRETYTCPTSMTSLYEEDFHDRNTKEPVTITVTFSDLSERAKEDLKDYVRQDCLIVSAKAFYDPVGGRAEVKQFGLRLGMREFADFFSALGDKQRTEQLKAIYDRIREEHSEFALVKAATRPSMEKALREYENAHPEAHVLLESEDEFYGISKGINRLEKHIQWVYIPAVKDASTEQIEAKDTALGRLLKRAVSARTHFTEQLEELKKEWRSQYELLLNQNKGTLDGISSALAERLMDWAHPNARVRLEWNQDANKAVSATEPLAQIIAGEGDFEGELPRFGHGLQRSYLLALLQELASTDDTTQPTLILGCEEPELYQHPPQARHLASVLEQLSEGNTQVIVCTHSPYLVSGKGFEDIRLVRKIDGDATVSRATFDQVSARISEADGRPPVKPTGISAKIHQSLKPTLNEMFFSPQIIFVEGLEDIAYITTYLHHMELWSKYRRSGCHLIATEGKTTMIFSLAIAKCLDIPTYTVFDSDGQEKDPGNRNKHKIENEALMRLCGIFEPNPFPEEVLSENGLTVWPTEIGSVVKMEIGEEVWKGYAEKSDIYFGRPGGLTKNSLFIADVLSKAWQDNRRSKSLEQLCMAIIDWFE